MPLNLDTMFIDTDAETITLTWRGLLVPRADTLAARAARIATRKARARVGV